MEAKDYIEALAKELGKDFQLDENGTLLLEIDSVPLVMQWRSLSMLFHVQMPLGEVSFRAKRLVLEKLISANFMAIETLGSFISYNEEVGTAFLESFIHVQGTGYNEFIQAVEEFVRVVDAWRTRLDEINNECVKTIEEMAGNLLDSQDNDEEIEDNSNFIKV